MPENHIFATLVPAPLISKPKTILPTPKIPENHIFASLVPGPSTSTSSPETLGYTKVCQELEGPLSQTGQCNTLNESIPRLATLQINDKINSIHQSGAWIYYEHVNYNNQPGPGRVWYVFDDDLSIALPPVLRSRPTTHGIPDTIKSAKRGCSSTAIAMPQLLTKTGLWEDGYWKDGVDFLSSYVAEDVSE
ncbi:hypothetical protein GWK47_025002 [Chionoecetes opilio]|uniref:Beta/gamma crystallin 'Greek key' domain-containing protein n=1 Tax=Chionoecetes opilio TaxID=41210 RepID=A0A8J5CIZ7_CHIOP|nr:hypothetical protein GWK47_025002 [Chionoecetes opilio]